MKMNEYAILSNDIIDRVATPSWMSIHVHVYAHSFGEIFYELWRGWATTRHSSPADYTPGSQLYTVTYTWMCAYAYFIAGVYWIDLYIFLCAATQTSCNKKAENMNIKWWQKHFRRTKRKRTGMWNMQKGKYYNVKG